MQRIQIRPLTGAVNLPLNIAALGLKEMEGARREREMEGDGGRWREMEGDGGSAEGGSHEESEQRER